MKNLYKILKIYRHYTIPEISVIIDEAIKNIERNGDSKLIFFDISLKIGQIFKKKYFLIRA